MLVEGGQCLVEVRDPLLDLLHYFLLFELLLLLDQVLEVEAALQLADVPEDYPSQLFEVVPFLIRITALEFGQEASPVLADNHHHLVAVLAVVEAARLAV